MWNDVDLLTPLLRSSEMKNLLDAAQSGNREALGLIFERFRPFLLQIANEEIDPRLRQKSGGSDLVQQSLMEANQAFEDFEGNSPDAFAAWIRKILLNNLANLRRHFQTDKRSIDREVQLQGSGSAALPLDQLQGIDPTKSDSLNRQEELAIVHAAFHRLAPDYQQVIRLRNEDKKSFQEIGDLMNRSADAARKLWARAIESLKAELDTRFRT